MSNFNQNGVDFTVAEYTPTLVTNRVSTATQAKLLAGKAGQSINAIEIDWNDAVWSSIPGTTAPTTIKFLALHQL